jgi:5-(carboxyamino)imidazole ribonucleotide synthase
LTQLKTHTVIGIIGDGQLALMLADSLTRLGLDFYCLSETDDSPMQLLYPARTLREREVFRHRCSIFSLENEFLSQAALKDLLQAKIGALFPEIDSYTCFGDKISQRNLYQSLGLPSPQWMALERPAQLPEVAQRFQFPLVLKASQGGYDGKGVRIVHSSEALEQAARDFGLFEGRALLIEEKVQIKQELAQGFVRDAQGRFTMLPLVETVQEDGVCNLVFYPPNVSVDTSNRIEQILNKLMQRPLVGIFNFEFFLTHAGEVFINEGAPRPHNSQHLTIDASNFSQFDLLALYLAGNPQLPEKLETRPSAMINILGRSAGENYQLILPEVEAPVELRAKLYGKKQSSMGRKLGHVNLVDASGSSDLPTLARRIFKEYRI